MTSLIDFGTFWIGKTRFARMSAMLLLLLASSAFALDVHVSPDGSDSGPGTLEEPMKTPAAAQELARSRAGREPVAVILHDGIYYLDQPLVLTFDDSGAGNAPVVYRAANEGKAILSGGMPLQLEWAPYRDGIYQAKTPAGLAFDQLFVNGVRQLMARYPNYDPAKSDVPFHGSAEDAIAPERVAKWADPAGGFMHAMHAALWGDMHYLITGKDGQGNLAYVGGWQNNRRSEPHARFRFVEHIFEELDAPGEWFLDGKNATLYFQPPADVELDAATVEIVRLANLVEFRGSRENPVRFVELRGIVFRHATRTFMDNKEPLLRSDWTTYRGGAICFNGAEDCIIRDAVIDQVGGNAVFVNHFNRRITVRDSVISEAGANGIAFVGSPEAVRSPLFGYGQTQPLENIDRTPGPKTEDYPADCLVEECLIYRTGRFEKQTAPVQIAMAMSITVRHCSIYDVPRAGINICDGCWGGHTIAYCDVFDTVKETGDHGSFNSWGRDRFWRPSISETSRLVDENPDLALLDVVKPITLANSRWRCDHGWDIDLDDGSSNYRLYNNLMLHGGLKNREGFHRVVENNIMLGTRDGTYHPHVWYEHSRDVFRNNIVSAAYKPIGMSYYPWGEHFDNNILQAPGQEGAAPATVLQNASGQDPHSVLADVQFVDPAQGNYQVRPGSIALTLGFKNFPMDQFGVSNPKLRALARTPVLPGARSMEQVDARNPDVREFLGGKVQNVVGMGEVSAYGLPGEIGAILIEVPAGSAAAKAGLKQDDVILKCRNANIRSVEDLFAAWSAAGKGDQIELAIWRLQQHASVTVEIE
jgi:hypothetical protein